jgi:hypothetical protein
VTDRPGPGGPWPLDPQVPPYEQPSAAPSYAVPSQPYSPPQPPAYPVEAPSFVPAGQYYQAQPYQAQPYQGQPYQGQPYAGQPYAPQPPGSQPPFQLGPDRIEPDRVPVRYGVMAVLAVVLLAVIGVGVVVWSMTSTPRSTAASVWTVEPTTAASKAPSASSTPRASTTQPSATSTPTTSSGSTAKNTSTTSTKSTSATENALPACIPGQKIVTAAWTAIAPSGWSCLKGSTSNGTVLGLVNAQKEIIAMGVVASKDAATACGADLANQTISVTAQPDTLWGGKVAKTITVAAMGLEEEYRCVESNGIVYMMVGDMPQDTRTSVIAAMNALTSSWVWK